MDLEKMRSEAKREIEKYQKEQRKQFKEELKWCENLTTEQKRSRCLRSNSVLNSNNEQKVVKNENSMQRLDDGSEEIKGDVAKSHLKGSSLE